MAQLKEAEPGLIFASCIYSLDYISDKKLEETWLARYQLDGKTEPEFNPSLDYYSKEMGENLKRVILWCNQKWDREELVEGKLWADKIEQATAINGKRIINIDVGMVFKEQLLLATSKPYSHRIYLRGGVWAELTFKYENKSYHSLPWTYPDYQAAEKVELFNSLRLGLF